MDLEKFYKEKHVAHWAEELQIADRVTATIRHKTDGSKNIHGTDVILIKNLKKESKIIGWWNDKEYEIPYNELKAHK